MSGTTSHAGFSHPDRAIEGSHITRPTGFVSSSNDETDHVHDSASNGSSLDELTGDVVSDPSGLDAEQSRQPLPRESGRSPTTDATADISGGHATRPHLDADEADSSFAVPLVTPFAKHLGRNRACAACRERKLKCDGVRPICGQCGRAWAARRKSMLAKGHSENDIDAMETPCSYIAVEPRKGNKKSTVSGSPSNQNNKSNARKRHATDSGTLGGNGSPSLSEENRKLSREVAELRALLQAQRVQSTSSADELSIAEILANTMRGGESSYQTMPSGLSGRPTNHRPSADPLADQGQNNSSAQLMLDPSMDFGNLPGDQDGLRHIAVSDISSPSGNSTYSHPLQRSDMLGPLLLDSAGGGQTGASGGQGHGHTAIRGTAVEAFSIAGFPPSAQGVGSSTGSSGIQQDPDPMLELVFSGWPTDFPPPQTVDLLVNIFFENFPFLHIFHPGRFLNALMLGPHSPRYPHPSALHAMFALSYTLRPDLDPVAQSRQANAQPLAGSHGAQKSIYDIHRSRGGSADYHTARCQHHIFHGTFHGGNLYDIARAACLLCNKKYACGDLLEAWMHAGHSTRLMVALNINRERSRSTPSLGQPIEITRMIVNASPKDWVEEEERRRAMFSVLATDRSAAATTLWASSLAEADVDCDLPVLPHDAFLSSDMTGYDYSRRQNCHSDDFLTGGHHDAVILLIKGFMMVGRCGALLARLPRIATVEDLLTSEFDTLSNSVGAFAMSFPPNLSSYLSTKPDGQLDPVLITAHALPHCATLLLHDPLALCRSESFAMCRAACSAVLAILRMLAATSTNLALFPPLFSFIVTVTGRNILRRMQHNQRIFAQSGGVGNKALNGSNAGEVRSPSDGESDRHGFPPDLDAKQEKQVAKSEIDMVVRTLCKYGQTWPVGIRQAQALTRQMGVPLDIDQLIYEQEVPSSHQSHFQQPPNMHLHQHSHHSPAVTQQQQFKAPEFAQNSFLSQHQHGSRMH
ncbi:hypothetical protein IE81DRAFT_131944 [Ceraceosorus guamensis]|uniref:Zn(2)-C6 fungal-type domain-containing protein n=1 Tax=Ceraceosorus guamensis TaxID=1522189 RepID=A0A316WA74_9BASI|nr:hypothetical protein IE81DRAFT_131944 [Ceraceosorus guamensis]PWN45958.1 hypothetical protein IE81DRAFT_131944 [Ceraceosorus guamensis]